VLDGLLSLQIHLAAATFGHFKQFLWVFKRQFARQDRLSVGFEERAMPSLAMHERQIYAMLHGLALRAAPLARNVRGRQPRIAYGANSLFILLTLLESN